MHGLNSFTCFAMNHRNLLPDNARTASNIRSFYTVLRLHYNLLWCNLLSFFMVYIVVNSHMVKVILNIII